MFYEIARAQFLLPPGYCIDWEAPKALEKGYEVVSSVFWEDNKNSFGR